MVALLADAFPETGLAPSRGLPVIRSDRPGKTCRDISTLRAMIQFYVDRLDSRPLSADERRVIKNRLNTLISELQPQIAWADVGALVVGRIRTDACDIATGR